MSDKPDDDLATQLLEGDPYEQASVAVRRMVPLSLDTKILLAVGSLGLSALAAPAALTRRDLVRSLEETGSLELTLGVLALNGVVTSFVAGLALVRQQRVTRQRSLDSSSARKLVRIEDFLSMFVILGAMFVAVPVALLGVGVASPGTVESLYGDGVEIYSKTSMGGVDVRLVSATGGILAVVLLGVWQLYAR